VWPAVFTPALTTDEQRGRAHEMAPERSRRLLLKLGPLLLGDTKKLVIGTIGRGLHSSAFQLNLSCF